MIVILMVVLAVIGGALLSAQVAVNGRLAAEQGAIRTTFLTFLVGTVFCAVLVVLFEPRHALTLLDVPKWQLLGSFLGLIYVLTMAFAVGRIGTAVATVAVILGQLLMSILIDNFGWMGNHAIAFSTSRCLAAVCLAIALYFIYTSNAAEVELAEEKASA